MSTILKTLVIILGVYILLCLLFYFFQEKLIFFPEKLNKKYQFNFGQKFEEINIKSKDGVILNSILFKADHSEGVIFYLHGNAGSLNSWGAVAKTYTDLNYDVFIIDYRGYGKSEGRITSQEQLFDDNQYAYDELKKRYPENEIIILGYSIGTGMAARLASTNNPRLLILQAPYYNIPDLVWHIFPLFPDFLYKYKLSTNRYVEKVTAPIVIFHGDQDEVIYVGSSLKLKKKLKDEDTLILLKGQNHNGMTDNPDYQKNIKTILTHTSEEVPIR